MRPTALLQLHQRAGSAALKLASRDRSLTSFPFLGHLAPASYTLEHAAAVVQPVQAYVDYMLQCTQLWWPKYRVI